MVPVSERFLLGPFVTSCSDLQLDWGPVAFLREPVAFHSVIYHSYDVYHLSSDSIRFVSPSCMGEDGDWCSAVLRWSVCLYVSHTEHNTSPSHPMPTSTVAHATTNFDTSANSFNTDPKSNLNNKHSCQYWFQPANMQNLIPGKGTYAIPLHHTVAYSLYGVGFPWRESMLYTF